MQEAWARVALKMKSYLPDVIDEIRAKKEESDTGFDYGANASEKPEENDEEFEL